MKQKILTGHRRLEGWTLVFTLLTVVAVAVGGLVEFLPIVLVQDTVPKIEAVRPFRPLEVAGRDVYIREGCVNCHSQMIRPFRAEMERYGDYTKAGETVYEHPFLWGSKRTGPDLQRVGGKYPHLWHVRHMENPRSTSPASIMPPYPWLLEDDLDFGAIAGKLRALRRVGVPYTDAEIASAETDAQAQAAEIARDVAAQGGPARLEAKEIVALVAYLQRMGADVRAAQGPRDPASNTDTAPHPADSVGAGTTRPAGEAVPTNPNDRPGHDPSNKPGS